MPLLAIGLVLTSCVLHAYWNLLFKQARSKTAFTAVFLSLIPLLYLPMPLVMAHRFPFPREAWWCVLGTGLAYAGYFEGLGRAYESGELSVAYPVARSVGPAFTLIWGVLLLAERPTPAGLVGVLLTIAGAALVQWKRLAQGVDSGSGRMVSSTYASRISMLAPRTRLSPSVRAALFVALMYSVYSLIDKIGVGRLHANPATYIYLTYSAAAILVVPNVIRRHGMAPIALEWRVNWRSCVAVAVMNMLAYLLVLCAMSLPHTPVSYITPLRTTSVLIGVVLGVEVLKEGSASSKLAGAALMASGIVLMAWKG